MNIVKPNLKNIVTATVIVFCVNACTNKKNSDDMNNAEEKVTVATSNSTLHDFYKNYIDAANARDFATITSMINDDVMINGEKRKKEDAIAGFKWLIDNVPNYKWQIEDLFVDGERIAVRLRDRGTPVKNFFGNKPTGGSIEITEFASYKIRNGKFVEMWYLIDSNAITEQLKK